MGETPRHLPGALFVSVLLAMGLGFAGWLRFHRPVAVLQDVGADHAPIHGLGWPDLIIDVNSAEEAQLDLLPGIGPRLAARIVEERDQEGSFASLDDVAAGPISTVAARSIPGIEEFVAVWGERAPLVWDMEDPEPIAQMVCVLLSDWAPATTGEIIHVDGGFHAFAMARLEE